MCTPTQGPAESALWMTATQARREILSWGSRSHSCLAFSRGRAPAARRGFLDFCGNRSRGFLFGRWYPSAAVAPPALTEYRALREAALGGAGAAIATSRAAAVAVHPAAALGAVSAALGAVGVAGSRTSAAVAPPALSAYRALGGGGAGRRWRCHRHEPRGGGRSAPGGGSRRRLYGVWRRLTEAAQGGAGVPIATSRAAAVAVQPAAALGATRVRGAVNSEQRGAGMPPATSLAEAVV
ncbi:hypothetical protein EMIHUDRAFT_237168 [Emiliania huxleyi CCMP1516]|uniref:Uncharacterized protein n=2 Tax=Emiliania huxleyi TaxID=2903 RepID=A0A0D3JR92_EMIH1|nr:hypothetical protein EMIHUDRAFT_237168 [Emiliania huxleyi CCMP1516]EOD26027.1 hypothetical protein EMIHUDRAFT_237168 [Emiliania huxleyi CCMP1516]|eukprot:XP_005778456.1 hypothetical protein EMIHUDRAFT_237168 [Emiliania huxleyi CCMP1516]